MRNRRDFLWQMFLDSWRFSRPPTSRPSPKDWSDQNITGSCLGHSTVLLNFRGLWILTDPVFSSRVGPGIGPFVIGPKRFLKPALKPHQFPQPDVIVLSHAHFDHLDRRSLRRFSRDTPIITARGTADLLRRFRQVHELSWGETVTVSTNKGHVRFTGLEIAHWGARMMRDEQREYCGYLIERDGRSVCYAGDTALTAAFGRVRDLTPSLDLILMPIGAYDPWIRSHCSPEQAVAMADDAGARHFVPIHHETYRLSDEPMDEPSARLQRAFAGRPSALLAVHVGETFVVPS